MNILILISRFDFGGAENYVRELANALSEKGEKVFVCSKDGRQRRLLSSQIVFKSMRFSKWLVLPHLFRLLRLIKKHNIDVIHAHQPSAILTGCLVGRLVKRPVIVTIHSTTRLELLSNITRSTPARIIYISRFTMERSDWYGALRPRCRYIPNGIQWKATPCGKNGMRIVYCSRIDKSHAELLHLFIHNALPTLVQKFPMLTFDIVGDGKKICDVKQWAEKLNKLFDTEVIRLIGFQERFVTHGALVIGVGRVALEALGFGIPVLSVSCRRGGPRITCANYDKLSQNNFVDVTAPRPTAGMLIESISDILNNYDEVLIDSRALQHKVFIDFNLETMVEKIRLEYKDVITSVLIHKKSRRTTLNRLRGKIDHPIDLTQ